MKSVAGRAYVPANSQASLGLVISDDRDAMGHVPVMIWRRGDPEPIAAITDPKRLLIALWEGWAWMGQ